MAGRDRRPGRPPHRDNFNAPLTVVGVRTITLTATDRDNNVGVDSLVLNIQ